MEIQTAASPHRDVQERMIDDNGLLEALRDWMNMDHQQNDVYHLHFTLSWQVGT